MTIDQKPEPPTESHDGKEILTKNEKKMVERSLRKFASYLRALKPDDLPKVVLFSDTSARPFAYALKPILDKVSAASHVPAPVLLFVKTFNENIVPSLEEALNRRIATILERYCASIDDRVLLVDEFVSLGRTLDGMGDAVESLRPGQALTKYGIVVSKGYEDGQKRLLKVDHYKKFVGSFYTFDGTVYRENLNHPWSKGTSRAELLIGAVNTYDDNPSSIGTSFSFVGEEKESYTGVEKYSKPDAPMVSRSQIRNPARMLQLREELSSLGRRCL